MEMIKSTEWFKRLILFLKVVNRNIINDRISSRATSLAFTSTMSLVPLTMIIFSFGGFDQFGSRLMEAIGQLLLPEGNDEIIKVFSTFTSNARRLGAWGTLLFLFTAIMLFNSMESHLNGIFRARPQKGLILRFGMYISSMALISLVFGIGFGSLSGAMDAWNNVPEIWRNILRPTLSVIGSMLGMMMLFRLLSAARVNIKSAALGAFAGSLGLQTAKFGFTLWTTHSVKQSIIYGSLMFIPLLLIWLDVAWIVILISAEITYAHQIDAGRKPSLRHLSPAYETEIAWKVFLALVEDFQRGKIPPDIKTLSNQLSVDELRVDTILRRLEAGGIIHQIARHPPGFIPARAPGDLDAADVFAVITGWNRPNDCDVEDDASSIICKGIESTLSNRSVLSFLSENKNDSS